jgi:hypothetical protein
MLARSKLSFMEMETAHERLAVTFLRNMKEIYHEINSITSLQEPSIHKALQACLMQDITFRDTAKLAELASLIHRRLKLFHKHTDENHSSSLINRHNAETALLIGFAIFTACKAASTFLNNDSCDNNAQATCLAKTSMVALVWLVASILFLSSISVVNEDIKQINKLSKDKQQEDKHDLEKLERLIKNTIAVCKKLNSFSLENTIEKHHHSHTHRTRHGFN